ncbi:hypothetical protein EsDP_00002240 [Epichloe bromicola]|uniref:DUF7924 domain-containing protein n=1 Tax=Epichloe bromicola TaxID=79588 RepID=A0ABQ0CK69_9HYPO
MAHDPVQQASQKGRTSLAARDSRKRPLGIQKRRSSRQAVKTPTPEEQPPPQRTRREHLDPSPINKITSPTASQRGTKRRIDAFNQESDSIQKRPRRSPRLSPANHTTSRPDVNGANAAEPIDPVGFWTQERKWPREYFEPGMEQLLARKRSLPTLNRKRSNSATSTTPSDQRQREEKSAPYRDARYELLLQTKGSYMDTSELGITDSSKRIIQDLLGGDQLFPKDTIFDDSVFVDACRNLRSRNEARVIQDISRLIVPSAETLSLHLKSLRHLTESVNEGWNNSMPLTGTRPQPDFSLGFRREAFNDLQLAKLSPFIGNFISGDQSLFIATYYMYFPFLTCEVKCGAAALDVADRQNAHSMTLAVRAITALFRAVKREDEVHRHIQAFSISHDHGSVRIYGHYPVLEGKNTKYYRHPIRKFDFTELDGKEKWTSYLFIKNLYELWVPSHFERLCSAINQLPSESNFDNLSLP